MMEWDLAGAVQNILKDRAGVGCAAAICTGEEENNVKAPVLFTAKEYCNNTGALHQPIHLSNAYSVFPYTASGNNPWSVVNHILHLFGNPSISTASYRPRSSEASTYAHGFYAQKPLSGLQRKPDRVLKASLVDSVCFGINARKSLVLFYLFRFRNQLRFGPLRNETRPWPRGTCLSSFINLRFWHCQNCCQNTQRTEISRTWSFA